MTTDANTCDTCKVGYYGDTAVGTANNTCTKCTGNCATCSAASTCLSCIADDTTNHKYYSPFGNGCKECSTGCGECTTDSACTTCRDGWAKNTLNACIACSTLTTPANVTKCAYNGANLEATHCDSDAWL